MKVLMFGTKKLFESTTDVQEQDREYRVDMEALDLILDRQAQFKENDPDMAEETKDED